MESSPGHNNVCTLGSNFMCSQHILSLTPGCPVLYTTNRSTMVFSSPSLHLDQPWSFQVSSFLSDNHNTDSSLVWSVDVSPISSGSSVTRWRSPHRPRLRVTVCHSDTWVKSKKNRLDRSVGCRVVTLGPSTTRLVT